MDIVDLIELFLLGRATTASWDKSAEKVRADAEAGLYDLRQARLNTRRINNIVIPQVKTYEFRPRTWQEFIGQTDLKERVKTIVAQFKRGIKAHCFLSAIRGHGKNSFAELIAKSIGAKFITRIGAVLTSDSLIEVINEINGTQVPCVFFLDEAETCNKKIIKTLNSVVESFKLSDQNIRPFMMICASINKNILVKNNPDFLDRLPNHLYFQRYTVDELTQIITQVYQNLYKGEFISSENLRLLAENSKRNPRSAISLLEAFVVDHNIGHVFKTWGIIQDGLTVTDVKILEFLATQTKPVGANSIALKCGMSQNEYINEWEGFLFEFGYISRTPSRQITPKGKQFLESISKKG